MRYKVVGRRIIRSENAAKPPAQRSMHLHKFISSLPEVEASFDLGCGKLRYVDSIRQCSRTITLIDSEIQLSRTQNIGLFGRTSIREICRDSNVIHCQNIREFRTNNISYDRGFCLNVLPIIPSESIRRNIVRSAFQRLKRGGKCYFVHHYRNAEYRRLCDRHDATPFRDGYIIDGFRGY